MKNSLTEINKIINKLSDNILLTQADESYVLQDKQNMMSFSLDLDEYEKIIIRNKTHVLKKIFKKEGLKILDCTGGFGRDSAIIASLGNNDVTLIEDNPMIMKILRDAIRRIKNNKIEKIFNSMTIKLGNCLDYIKNTNKRFDYLYFDFMFNTNKSALPSKREQFLRKVTHNNININRDIIAETLQRVGSKVIIKEHAKSNDYKHLDIINTYKEKVVKYHLLQGKNEHYKLYK